jgi:hypothetical protein
MNTQEHLQRIKAKCQELLAIWDGKRDHNIIYTASCGKQAEAGWKATIAAIDGIVDSESSEITHSWAIQYNAATVARICEAWPEELL